MKNIGKYKLIALLVFSALLVSVSSVIAFRIADRKYREVLLTFENADGNVTKITADLGTTVQLPKAAEFEGYSFLGWTDEYGNMYYGDSMQAKNSGEYTTLYTVALNDKEHIPYLFPDEHGNYNLELPVTRAAVAQMLYPLLAVEIESNGNYIDVPKTAEYAQAVGALYQLQTVEGKRFYPDEYITRGELISLLCAFYPKATTDFELKDVPADDYYYHEMCTAVERGWISRDDDINPDETITKLEAVKLINSALGRTGPDKIEKDLYGLCIEVPYYEENYACVVEAALTHEYTVNNGAEVWTSHDTFTPHEEEFVIIDRYLYYVTDEGIFLRNDSVNGFDFDEDGRYTTGNKELDEIVHNVLTDIIDDDYMDKIDMLRAIFEYVRDNFSYTRRMIYYYNVQGWEEEEAYNMFVKGTGNCYSYAAVFYYLARAIGYDARTCIGRIGVTQLAHGWVEIEIDGTNYVFDPELEMAQEEELGKNMDLFMIGPEKAKSWRYTKVTDSAAA